MREYVSSVVNPDGRGRSPLDLTDAGPPLIAADEGSPVETVNPEGAGDVVLICEHAGNLVPRSLHALGLDHDVLTSHVAFDPGAAEVARLMAARLDAPLILQRISRLVYDCNRPPDAESAMPARSEIFDIPGNTDITDAQRRLRTEAVYRPFRAGVAAVLDRSIQCCKTPAVVTIHSFTPIFHGERRSVELGLLHDVDTSLADAMLDASASWSDLNIQRNQPYGPKDGVTHTLEVDAIARNLANVMIEIRNDLIRGPRQQATMAARLADLVSEAIAQISSMETPRNPGASR